MTQDDAYIAEFQRRRRVFQPQWQRTIGVVFFTVVLICCGCASSSDSPAISTYHEPETFDVPGTIRYRTLTRDDFQGLFPPNQGRGIPTHASAALVGAVRVDPQSILFVTQLKAGSDSTLFETTVRNLRFQSVMDPKASWWGEDLDSVSTAYVLQHEQIHFAIFELEARSLNAHASEIAMRIRSVGPTSDEARRTANARMEEERRAWNQRVEERQNQFERETANGKLQDRQMEWWSRIQGELVNTSWDD
jgi:hypothetical protein